MSWKLEWDTFKDELGSTQLHDNDLDALAHVNHAHVEGCVSMLQHLHANTVFMLLKPGRTLWQQCFLAQKMSWPWQGSTVLGADPHNLEDWGAFP